MLSQRFISEVQKGLLKFGSAVIVDGVLLKVQGKS